MESPFPSVCAWCGSLGALSSRPIKVREETLTGFYLVAHTTRVREYRFSLPVCAECDAQLRRSRRLLVASSVLPALFGCVVPAALFAWQGVFDVACVIAPVGVAVLGAIGGAVAGSLLFKYKQWGRVQGGRFEFYNDDFRAAFAARHPSSPSDVDGPDSQGDGQLRVRSREDRWSL